MFVIVYEYEVDPPRRDEFERTYAADGPWAALFGRADGYLGTELLRADRPAGDRPAGDLPPGGRPPEEAVAERYLLIDRWERRAAFDGFQEEHGAEYAEQDRRFRHLNAGERRLGGYQRVEPGPAHRREGRGPQEV